MRSEWTFNFLVQEVLDAAKEKVNYHAGRLAYWSAELSEAEKDLQENGIIIKNVPHVSQVGFSNSYHSDVQMDPVRQRRVFEAQAKRDEHQLKLETFERWTRTLRREPHDSCIPLEIDDVEFFGL